jgi:hypothetical protein
VIRHSRLTALGIVLCLLAALFAVEAKIAWYCPAGTASSQISAAKLQLVDASKQILHGAPMQAPPAFDFTDNAAVVALALLCIATMSLMARTAPRRLHVAASPGFQISLFFRPPPTF